MKKPCNCQHPAQDKLNGTGVRVHNVTERLIKDRKAVRCTVCGKES